MIPAHWSAILKDLLDIKVQDYEEQESFLRRALPYITLTRSKDLSLDFRPYIKSFSYATQLHGLLKGHVNLVASTEEAQEQLADFFVNYYKYVGRHAECESASIIASQEIGSWGNESDAPMLDADLTVLTDFETVMDSYPHIVGLAGVLGRCSKGVILISMQSMDSYAHAFSASQGKYASWENFGTVAILDLLEIYEETNDD